MLPHGRLVVDDGRFGTHGRFISYSTLFRSRALGSFLPPCNYISPQSTQSQHHICISEWHPSVRGAPRWMLLWLVAVGIFHTAVFLSWT